ncbi:MAG: hypothetical protein CMO66_04920 [Verrucomicrobiales bacterium]|nr:hypothetical protein [Verrucomicrobiales bacterium]
MPSSVDRREFLRAAAMCASVPLACAGSLAHKAPIHTVQRGDTLTAIGRRHGLSVRQLKLWNGLSSDLILIGQKLLLKPTYKNLPLAAITRPKVDIRKWRHLIIHHSATPNGSARIFDGFHRQKGMENGLAYHFVIGNGTNSPDGAVEVGNRWTSQLNGGHVSSETFNANSIGICLVGNFERQNPTRRQVASLVELADYLKNRMLHQRPKFMLHRELEQTLCPGRNFPAKHLHQLFG